MLKVTGAGPSDRCKPLVPNDFTSHDRISIVTASSDIRGDVSASAVRVTGTQCH